MLLKKILLIALSILVASMTPQLNLIPVSAGGSYTPDPDYSIPSLPVFIAQVAEGPAEKVAGVYVKDILALPVIQQPANQPGYVSTRPDTITQFSMAEQFGSIGLLAHNFAAGDLFFDLQEGDLVILIHGDGHLQHYQISSTASYQALEPSNPRSAFRELSGDEIIPASELFSRVYAQPGEITFQTCIAMGDIDSWGRYFVHASPVTFPLVSTTEIGLAAAGSVMY
jgi:hypothetical protein